jgi:hypothetical protein
MEEDPYNTPAYAELCARLAKDCRCGCFECANRPCDGLLAGGMCDEATCHCTDDDRWGDEDEDV